jgi:hypothetical protein
VCREVLTAGPLEPRRRIPAVSRTGHRVARERRECAAGVRGGIESPAS